MSDYIQNILGNNIMLFIGILFMANKTPKRNKFWLRFALCFVAYCLWRYVYFEVTLPSIPRDYYLWFNMLGFIQVLVLTILSVFVCYECDFWTALFCGTTSYNIQHVYQRTYDILARMLLKDAPVALYVLLYVGILIVCAGLVYLVMKRLRIDKIVVNNRFLLTASLLMVLTAVVLDLLSFRAMRAGGDTLIYYIYISSMIISILLFSLQLGSVSGKKRELELVALKAMLDEERDQYRFEKSMIDMVNIKCHDIKHQIAALDESARKKLRADIDPVIEAYDSSFRTGNAALDVVLTRENFNCQEKGIGLTCVADGKCLNFMSEVDVYSLFGNILDNAIEATEKLEDPDKRIISMAVFQEGYFVNIHVENYFGDKLTFFDGLPETTKADTVYHGFGLRSIQMLVQKYDGGMKIRTNKDRFVLDIMFSM